MQSNSLEKYAKKDSRLLCRFRSIPEKNSWSIPVKRRRTIIHCTGKTRLVTGKSLAVTGENLPEAAEITLKQEKEVL